MADTFRLSDEINHTRSMQQQHHPGVELISGSDLMSKANNSFNELIIKAQF